VSRKHALLIFRAALVASDPETAVLRHLSFDGRTLRAGRRRYAVSRFDRIRVIGAGKASAAMARAVERVLGRRVAGGFVNANDGNAHRSRRIHLHPSGHPLPDPRGLEGTSNIARIAEESGPRDLLIAVISGGASAMMPDPAPPVTLADIQETTRELLACGATIHELNTIRKHISTLKGGGLARLAAPATIIALILSDVIGDNLDVIGSGPTAPDLSTFSDAARIFEKYSIRPPDAVWDRIQRGKSGQIAETPKPGDPAFARVQNIIVGSNRLAIDAAQKQARSLGYRPLVLSTFIDGEARDIARMHAAIAKEIRSSGRPIRPPACILSGGETTVTVRGSGRGGRNQEFVLACAISLENFPRATIFSGGTDGIDGPTDAAGAIADQTTLARARALGLDPRAFLAANDSYHFFERLQALVKTGPTGTNVMDIRILLIN
jgi:hydroxypyruvate reductase